MVLSLVKDEDTRYNKKKSTIKCRLCKKNETKTRQNGDPMWVKDIDVNKRWTYQFICYDCYYKKDEASCYRCGRSKSGNISMLKYYDNGIWNGTYICGHCYKKDLATQRNILLTIKDGGGSIIDLVIAEVLEIPTYSIFIGDKQLPFSLIHEYYGIIGTRVSNLKYNRWHFNIMQYVAADTYFLVGLDTNMKKILSVFIVPNKMKGSGRLYISKNSKRYKIFEVDSDPYDKIYQEVRYII